MWGSRWLLVTSCIVLPVTQSTGESDAYERVLGLFDEAQLVLLGERHMSKQDSDFRIALVRHPEFPKRVNDVVIEFGNSLYQDVLDAYFLRLEDVPDGQLNMVWRNTISTSGVWDSPIYEEFLRELRKVNVGLPEHERVRVIAGDPPIDWSRVEVFEDMLPFTQRGWSAVRQIEREVLGRGRKALVIYGYGHFLRLDDEMDEDDNVIRRLESLYPDKKFAVVVPFARTDGGALDLTDRVSDGLPAYVDSHRAPVGSWEAAQYLWGALGKLNEVVDALIYFGGEDERIRATEAFYEMNPQYEREIHRRRGLKARLTRRQSYN